MAIKQYLRIRIGNSLYLLPGNASVAIEKRDGLRVNHGGGNVVAWNAAAGKDWPAYALGENMKISNALDWDRAVFVDGNTGPVGLAAREIAMLTQTDIQVENFTPIGAPPGRSGHLFDGAWVTKTMPILVFNPANLAAYLKEVGG